MWYRVTRFTLTGSSAENYGAVTAERDLVGYVEADSRKEAFIEAREKYGSEREIGKIQVTAISGDPDDDEGSEEWREPPAPKRFVY